MDTKKLLMGTLAGTVSLFLLGFLFYGNLLVQFFRDHAGSATGVEKEQPEFLFLILGEAALALLITYIYLNWASIKTFATGAKAGALIGLLMGLHFSFIFYATTNLGDLTAALVDPLVGMIMVGISGGVIGWVLGMGNSK